MKQRLVSGPVGVAGVAFVIGLAAVTTVQSFAQTATTAQHSPASAASAMPMPMPMSSAPMKPMMPATDTAAPATQNGQPFDALKNNPNGKAWLSKFDRHPSDPSMSSGDKMPMKQSTMMKPDMMKSKMMKSDMMKSMMKSKMMKSKTKKSMGNM